MDKANFNQKERWKKVEKRVEKRKSSSLLAKRVQKAGNYEFLFFSLPAFLWTLSPAPSFYISKPCPHLFLTCEERRSLYRTSTSTLHQFSASGKLPWPPSSFPKPYCYRTWNLCVGGSSRRQFLQKLFVLTHLNT